MEMENSEVGSIFPKLGVKKVLQPGLGSAPVEKLNNEMVLRPAADIKRDLQARMCDLRRARMTPEPGVTDEEVG